MAGSATRTALILGATGGFGREAAAVLARHGWHVRALTRRSMPAADGIEWIAGDAMNAPDVLRAAEGAAAIVHAVNPPGYRDWDMFVLPMLDATIAAARAVGARIVLPGNIYNFGPDAFPLLREDSPQHPVSRKGAIRVAMEKRLEAAAAQGVRSLILRAGDFIGPHASGSTWFAQVVVKPGKRPTSIASPAPPGVNHAWAYLPDLTETVARLLDRDGDLPAFARFHFAGYQVTGAEMAAAVAQALGEKTIKVRRFPWFPMALLSPFVRLFRELGEMRYLWDAPIALDDARLRAFLGGPPASTPFAIAIRETLIGLGCISPAQLSPSHGAP
jgi:nucleoside-diphosphate-sugar epimerase